MSDDPLSDPVERAVRAHLDAEASRVDAARVLARIHAASAPAIPRRPLRRWASVATVAAAVAATVVFLVLPVGTPEVVVAQESAETLVRQAQTVHDDRVDRCYQIVADWDPALLKRAKLEPMLRTPRLWTRGDTFWIESTAADGHRVAWGRTTDGSVWVAPNRKRGLIYEASEISEPIARYCDLMSLRPVTTLGELLAHSEMHRRDEGKPGEPIRIEAFNRPTPLNPTPGFRRIELTLDPVTKVMQSARLWRVMNGEVVGTLTFTLVETKQIDPAQYELRGHLDADATILDGKPMPKLPAGRLDPRAMWRDEMLKRLQERSK